MRQTDGEIVAFSDANCTWSPDALRTLVRVVRRSGRRVRLRAAAHPRRRGRQQGGRLLELRDEAACGRVAARLRHRRQRLDLRRAPIRLRRGRPTFRPRSLASLPDGAARAARGVRARRSRLGEADAVERDRVPAQGADVRALLADRAAREDAPPARPALPLEIVSHRLLRYGSGILHVVLLATSLALYSHGWFYAVVLAVPAGPARRRCDRCGHRPLLHARHLGDARRARSTTCVAACLRPGRSRRAPGFEPGARRRDRRHGARRLEPVSRCRSPGGEAAGRRPRALPPDPGRPKTGSTSSC